MKKLLIILSCVALLLPAAALSAFADDSPSLTFVNLGSSNENIQGSFSLTVTSHSSKTISVSTDILSTVFGRFLYSGSYFYLRFYVDQDMTIPLSESSNDPTILTPGSSIYFSRDSHVTTESITYYLKVVVPPPPDPFEELGVNDGVDSSISYTGQILTFLSTNTATVVLIGLSVAMFAVLPFSIRKIKQIIKGY